MPRKSPIRHKVHSHKRKGKPVKSYQRGSGEKSRRSSKVVVKAPPLPGLKWTEKHGDYDVVWEGGRAKIYGEELGEQAVDEKGHPLETAYISWIEVDEPGRGYGRMFYEEIERGLEDRGFERVELDSEGADVFWEAMGFDYCTDEETGDIVYVGTSRWPLMFKNLKETKRERVSRPKYNHFVREARARTPRYGSAVPDVLKMEDWARDREIERVQREHWKKFKAQYPELKYDDVVIMSETAVKMKDKKVYRLKGEE